MKDFFVSIWIIIIIVVLVVGGGAAAGVVLLTRGPAELGGVAGWTTASQWVYTMEMPMDEMGTFDGTVTWRVTGEETVDGTACYKSEWTFDPSQWEMDFDGITATVTINSWKMWLEKDTTLPKKMEMEMTATAMGETHTVKMVATSSNSVSGTMWPLAVGNEFTVTSTTTTKTYMDGTLIGEDTDTATTTTKVEAEENVTVPAGTFNCFKMVSYDDGNIQSVEWYSTEVKNVVKGMANGTVLMELQSYSP